MEQDDRGLETPRLIMKPWELMDAEELFSLAKDPDVGPHAGWKPHETPEESRRIIQEIFIPKDTRKIISKETGRLVGCIGLDGDRVRTGPWARELGYWLGKEFWGQGWMTEAAKAMLALGFTRMGLTVVTVCTAPDNLRSMGVIEKLGFQKEGTLRRCYPIYDGSIRDSVYYSMLKEEWQASFEETGI